MARPELKLDTTEIEHLLSQRLPLEEIAFRIGVHKDTLRKFLSKFDFKVRLIPK